jgi:hypothetical protein
MKAQFFPGSLASAYITVGECCPPRSHNLTYSLRQLDTLAFHKVTSNHCCRPINSTEAMYQCLSASSSCGVEEKKRIMECLAHYIEAFSVACPNLIILDFCRPSFSVYALIADSDGLLPMHKLRIALIPSSRIFGKSQASSMSPKTR